MATKDIRIEEANITNRRHDDIVIILRHDFAKESSKNQIIIEYMNEYGLKFFNIQKDKLIEDGSRNSEYVLFGSILSQKTKQLLYEAVNDEIPDEFKFHDLAYIIRRISNFSFLNGDHEQVLVTLRIFHMYQSEHVERKKTLNSMYYYLIARSANFEIRLAEYRMAFLEKIGAKVVYNELTNIHNIQSTINELKMIIKYNNSHKNIQAVVSLIDINKFYHDRILVSSVINNFIRYTRVEDFIGHYSDNQLIVIFYDTDLENAKKPLIRLYNIVLSDKYIFDHYIHQKNEILAISYTQLEKNDDLESVNKRLQDSLEKSKHLGNELKIMQIDKTNSNIS